MVPVKAFKFAAAAAFAAALFVDLSASAQAQGVNPLEVTAARPTSISVSIRGKDRPAVRKDVRHAAYFVCRNFADVRGIRLDEVGACADDASKAAMKQYAAIVANRTVADAGVIMLSAR